MNASGMNESYSSWNFTRVNFTSGFPSLVCMHLKDMHARENYSAGFFYKNFDFLVEAKYS